jgi:hypothetical protein
VFREVLEKESMHVYGYCNPMTLVRAREVCVSGKQWQGLGTVTLQLLQMWEADIAAGNVSIQLGPRSVPPMSTDSGS